MAHLAVEDYLADIYRLQTEGGGERATTGSVAGRRGVAPASVTAMFKRLARDGYIVYREYEGASLTAEGQRLALDVVRRHRLVERFLTDILRLPWQSVDALADRMEHALPDAVVDALETLLGNPFTCPHGYPVPDKSGRLVEKTLYRLSELAPGASGTVARIDERVPGLLPYLEELGMILGTKVTVEGRNEVDETLRVRVDARVHVVGPRVAQAVSVEDANDPQ